MPGKMVVGKVIVAKAIGIFFYTLEESVLLLIDQEREKE